MRTCTPVRGDISVPRAWLCGFSHLILTITPRNGCSSPHFSDEENSPEHWSVLQAEDIASSQPFIFSPSPPSETPVSPNPHTQPGLSLKTKQELLSRK